MRVFVSIELPENVRDEIKLIQEQLPEFIGKKTELENLHLTLKFLGEVDEAKLEDIKSSLKEVKFPKLLLELGEIGVFSRKLVRIIWISLLGGEKLQLEIDNSLKRVFEPEKRFMSHLTLARVKNLKNRKNFFSKLGKIKYDKRSFVVDKFSLMKSILTKKGPIYEEVESFELR